MQQQNKKSNDSRQSSSAPPAVSDSSPPSAIDHARSNHRQRNTLKPRQLLNSADICSRFEQACGKQRRETVFVGRFSKSETP